MNDVMFFIALAAFVFFALSAAKFAESTKEDNKEKPKENVCPPHKWNYEKDFKDQEIMICSRCRRRPSYEGRE